MHLQGRHRWELVEDAKGRLYDRRIRLWMQRQRGVDPTAGEALAAMRAASHGFRLLMDRELEKHGLSEGRMALLYRLKPGPLPLSDLAEALNVTPRNVTGLVDHLEHDGLVARVPDEVDRRSTLAHLTPAGEAKLEELAGEMRRVRQTIVKEFSDEELEELRHLCLKMVRNLTEGRDE